MVGKMIFEDRFGFVEYGPFTGNERLLLAYGEQKSRRLLFDIIKIEKMTMSSPTLSTTGTQIVIYFVDTTYKYFTKRRFSKSWSDEPISDIMDHILQKMCTGGDNEQILLKRRDPSDTKVDFIMPYWTPMESISWLNKRTKPNSPQNVGNDIGGYLYYNNTHWDDSESKNKDNNFTAAWKSINGLFSYPITREDEWIDWENPFVFSGGPPGSTDDAPTYVNKILDWRYGGIDFTNIKKIQGGHMLGYNFDGKEYKDLPNKNIDTGMGLERIYAAAFNTTSVYKTPLFFKILEKIKEKLIKEGKIKKQKSLPPIKDEEIPFELPEGWVWCRLGEIIELVSGRDLKSPEYNDLGAGIPYITGASNFQDGELSIERWTENPKTISIRNDLLITCKGTIGEMAFNEHGELHIARQVMAIRTVINAISKYIQNIVYVNVDELNLQAKSLIPGISRDDVLNMLCPLPPLLEQENIVKRCSHLFNKLNKLDLINETIEEEIDFLNKIVFRDLFEE